MKRFIIVVSAVFLATLARSTERLSGAKMLLSEFIVTRFTVDIVYEEFILQGSLLEYLASSPLSLLPRSFVGLFLDPIPTHVTAVRDLLELEWHLMGNPIGESLYFGGVSFTFISPLIIAIFYIAINHLKLYRTLPGWLFLSFMIVNTRLSMRSGFYPSLLIYVYLMFSYLIWVTVLETPSLRRFFFPKMSHSVK